MRFLSSSGIIEALDDGGDGGDDDDDDEIDLTSFQRCLLYACTVPPSSLLFFITFVSL